MKKSTILTLHKLVNKLDNNSKVIEKDTNTVLISSASKCLSLINESVIGLNAVVFGDGCLFDFDVQNKLQENAKNFNYKIEFRDEIRNIMIVAEDGTNIMLHTNKTINEVKIVARKAKIGWSDIYEIDDSQIEFEHIDERSFDLDVYGSVV